MSYSIVRMHRDDRPDRIMRRGLTLEQAQAHCRREDTHCQEQITDPQTGETRKETIWFDGYQKDGK